MQEMQKKINRSRERVGSSFVASLWRRLSPWWLISNALKILAALEAITLIALQIIAFVRERRIGRDKHPFPYPHLDEVQVGENRLQLYANGSDLYDAMLEAIDNAQQSIYLETYIWKDDADGRELKKRLINKAMQGIEVYVIFDGFGNLVVPHAFKVFPSCVHAMEYRSITRPWHIFDPRHYTVDHRKLLIVDGYTAFVGGYNLGGPLMTEWRDTHLRIHGPAAADLAHSFIEFWNRACPKDDMITRRYRRRFNPFINVRGNDAQRLTFPIRDMYIEAIEKAERTILLTNAYFVPDHIFLNALKDAARRGVDVRLLVPWRSNHIVVEWLARGYFTDCLQAGIRIFGYRHTMLHAKTCTIDGQWSTVGTANLDRLSSIGNYEINVEIYSPDIAHQMQKLFECDTSNGIELNLDAWVSRPWYAKLSEIILAPLRVLF